MGKVIMFNFITLDGYFEGTKKWDLGWHQVDEEFNTFAIEQLNHAGGLIFGRVTYEGMAAYWSTSAAMDDDPQIAQKMNSIAKYVFSRTLDHVEWQNSRLLKGDAASDLKNLKQATDKDLFIFGSADLSSTFTKAHLIDEYRLMVNPVVLGSGGRLFKEDKGTIKFKLSRSQSFNNGNILLFYQPEGPQ